MTDLGLTRTWPLTVGDLELFVLESTDVDALLDAAIDDGSVAPYGVVLWHSAVAVAERLAKLGADGALAGKRVLDVGTGTGLCALTAAKLGAEVVAVDVLDAPLRLLEAAAEQQGLSIATGRFDIYSDAPLPAADVVIFADLLYELALARQCGLRAVEAVERGSKVLVGDPERAFRGAFGRVLERAGIGVRFDVAYVTLAADQKSQRCGVLEVGG